MDCRAPHKNNIFRVHSENQNTNYDQLSAAVSSTHGEDTYQQELGTRCRYLADHELPVWKLEELLLEREAAASQREEFLAAQFRNRESNGSQKHRTNYEPSEQSFKGYTDTIAEADQHYFRQRHVFSNIEVMRELSARVCQPKESFTDYFSAMNRIAAKGVFSEDELIRHIQDGLGDRKVEASLIALNPSTKKELLDHLQRIDRARIRLSYNGEEASPAQPGDKRRYDYHNSLPSRSSHSPPVSAKRFR